MDTVILDIATALGDVARGFLDGAAGLSDWVQAEPPIPSAVPVAPVGRDALGGLDALNGGPGVPLAGGGAGGGGGLAATKLDPISLFLQADIVVKAVMLMLVMASVWSWAIIVDKLLRLKMLFRRANAFEDRFWSGGSLDDLYDRLGPNPKDPMSSLFIAAMREWRRATGRDGAAGLSASLTQRIDRVMQITMSRELDGLERRLGFLASTGSVAPFVGLFGTVWGIMNSFHAIGASKDTSLATVAPGIAEALFATAIGLVAAIPAVVAYNKLSNDIDAYARRLEAFAGEFSAILSRQIEERTISAPGAKRDRVDLEGFRD